MLTCNDNLFFSAPSLHAGLLLLECCGIQWNPDFSNPWFLITPITRTKSCFPWIHFTVILPWYFELPIFEPIFVSFGGSRNQDYIVCTLWELPSELKDHVQLYMASCRLNWKLFCLAFLGKKICIAISNIHVKLSTFRLLSVTWLLSHSTNL